MYQGTCVCMYFIYLYNVPLPPFVTIFNTKNKERRYADYFSNLVLVLKTKAITLYRSKCENELEYVSRDGLYKAFLKELCYLEFPVLYCSFRT
jgi:hypothetical protein